MPLKLLESEEAVDMDDSIWWQWMIVVGIAIYVIGPVKLMEILGFRRVVPAVSDVNSNAKNHAEQADIASIWKRIGGAAVDLLLVIIATTMFLLIWRFFSFYIGTNVDENAWTARAILVWFTLDFIVTVVPMSGEGQATFGQRAVGIRTTKIDGGALTFGDAVARYFVGLVSSIFLKAGFIIALFTKHKRTLHDFAAGTIVVNE
jgi:uncharacterized RDD family membrane protein YckC